MQFLFLIVLGYAISGAAFLVLVLRVLHPYHRVLAGFLYGSSWVPFLVAGWKWKEKMMQYNSIAMGYITTYWWYIFTLLTLAGIGYILWILFPRKESPLHRSNKDEIAWREKGDMQNVLYIHDRFLELRNQFSEISSALDQKQKPSREKMEEIKNLWQEYYNLSFELDILKGTYRKFYMVNFLRHGDLHVNAFFIAYSALLLQYSSILLLTELVGKNEQLKTILNEKNNVANIRQNAYALLQKKVFLPDTLVRLGAGRAYMQLHKFQKRGSKDMHELCSKCQKEIHRITKTKPNSLLQNPIDYVEKKMFQSWFPVQKNVALQMSYFRITNRPYFIHPRVIAKYKDLLFPGDILFERREWHLTNVGIPGYWTHNALHIGTLQKMDTYFKSLDIVPSKFLQKTMPNIYEIMSIKDEHGFSVTVIEANREGVVLQSLEESAKADALAVLRPHVPLQEKWGAILRALSHFGKPYDYNFDFATDNQLVCSEVVYKAYEGTDMHLKLNNLNGRTIISPNDIMKKFDAEYDLKNRELDFVLFLDSKNSTQSVFKNTKDELRTSWRRPKWHIVFS